jgi:hypothetical protein
VDYYRNDLRIKKQYIATYWWTWLHKIDAVFHKITQ